MEPIAANEDRKVVVVEADADFKQVICSHLEDVGYRVWSCEDGDSAFSLALTHAPHIVVIAQKLRSGSGMEVCRVLRSSKAGQEIHFILIADQENEDFEVHAFENGVDDVIAKPLSPRRLLARVGAALRSIRLREQAVEDVRNVQNQVAALGVQTRKLAKDSLTDALTGLPNRRHAVAEMHRQWGESTRKERPLSVVMVDIDHFKKFNDSYGHDVGDVVLKETAAALQNSLRDSDTVCRLGGEEFLVIFPDTGLADAILGAERLRKAVAHHHISSGSFSGNVQISLGVAQKDDHTVDTESLLRAADEALYEAKESGRNCVRVHDLGTPVM